MVSLITAVERALNNWLARHHVLMVTANYEYAYAYASYVIAAFALVFWLYSRRPDDYPSRATPYRLQSFGNALHKCARPPPVWRA